MAGREVYMDYAATTPVDPSVAAAMNACLQRNGCFANPASSHRSGRAAARLVEAARMQVAQRIGAAADSIIFTSGATEADNLALRGIMSLSRDRGRHLITSRTEHKAVLDTAAALQRRGFQVSYLGCDSDGLIDPAALDEALTEETALVSIMHVNNETGVVQDIAALGARCRARGVLFHVDAAQSIGKIAVTASSWPVDLISLTAHKVYGPKGVGALYIRSGTALEPILFGGEQERGLRPGTLPVHQIVGMGRAYELADPDIEGPPLRELKERLWRGLAAIGGARRNGHAIRSAPHVLNVTFPGVNGESLRLSIDEIAVSAGSACNAQSLESSHVLSAMGLSDVLAESSVRFSLGRYTTAEEVDYVVGRVVAAVGQLRSLAPGAPAWCRS
jgi:cysteine desulfurase